MTGAIAIIPARGGSKGIPGKNLREVGGKPLIQWSIEQAKKASLATYVTTDDEAIASVAEECGAFLIPRPSHLAADDSTTESAIQHALKQYPVACTRPELIVLLQPTSPIRQPHDIPSALERMRATGADSLFSARRVEGFVWWERTNGWEPSYDPARREMRQVAQGKLEENGSIYIFKPWVLEKFNSRLGGKIVAHEMHPLDSFQVDEPSDLELMEQLIPLRMGGKSADWEVTLRDAIKRQMNCESLSAIARGCDVSQPQLHRFVNGERGLTLDSARKVAYALGLTAIQLPVHQEACA